MNSIVTFFLTMVGTYSNEVRSFPSPSLTTMKHSLMGLDEIKPGINGSSLRVEQNLMRMVDTLKSLPREGGVVRRRAIISYLSYSNSFFFLPF